MHQHQRQRARHDFQHAAGEVDGGAEGDDEAGHVCRYAVAARLLQRDGDGGGGRLGAERREVGGQHRVKKFQRISMHHEARQAVLKQQQQDVKHEDDADNFYKHHEHAVDLPRVGHVHEDAEDVDGQQRQYDGADGLDDDLPELAEGVLQRAAGGVGNAEAYGEGQDEGGHDVHQGRDGDAEVGGHVGGLLDVGQTGAGLYEAGEEGVARQVGQVAGEDGDGVGHEHRDAQHAPCRPADVADGGYHQPGYDEGDEEVEELAEEGVEGDKYARKGVGQRLADDDAQTDGDEDAGQQPEVYSFHNLYFYDAKIMYFGDYFIHL